MPKNAPVAQLDRATDFGSVGCGFDSYRARHFCREFLAFCADFVGFGFWRKAEFALQNSGFVLANTDFVGIFGFWCKAEFTAYL